MPYYPMMGWYPYMGFGTGLLWLIVIIVIAYLVYRLIKNEKILAPNRPVIKSAEDILAERYAKGELTREQYMQMKEDLKKPQ
jgi:putative membrane protein